MFVPNASRGEDYRAAIDEAQDERKKRTELLRTWSGIVAGSASLLETGELWQHLLGGSEVMDMVDTGWLTYLKRYFENHNGEDIARRMQKAGLLIDNAFIEVRWGHFISVSHNGDNKDKAYAYRDIVSMLDDDVYTYTERTFRQEASRDTHLCQPLAEAYGVTYTRWLYDQIQKEKRARSAKISRASDSRGTQIL